MQFSALVILACAFASAARPHNNEGSAVNVIAPVNIDNVANGNKVFAGNNILNKGHGKRGDIANVDSGATVTNVLNDNQVDILNNIANGKGKHTKRGSSSAVNVVAPVTIEEIFDCNNVDIANNILNNLVIELGCTLATIGIDVYDILNCNTGNWKDFVAKLNGNKSAFTNMGKRDGLVDGLLGNAPALGQIKRGDEGSIVNVVAPVKAAYILNDNNVKIANDIASRDAANIVAPVDSKNIANYNMVDVLNNADKRDGSHSLINVDAPICLKDILNCNDIKIANHILAKLAEELKCEITDLLVSALDIVHCNESNYPAFLAKLGDGVAKKLNLHRRDNGLTLVNEKSPIDISNVANDNLIVILDDLLVGGKRDTVKSSTPVDVSNIANYNVVDAINNVGKRAPVNVKGSVSGKNIGNGNHGAVANGRN